MRLPIGLLGRITVPHKLRELLLRQGCRPDDGIRIALLVAAMVTGEQSLADGAPVMANRRGWCQYGFEEVFCGETDEYGRFQFDRIACTTEVNAAPKPIKLSLNK
ncbi:MAG: hypothetical protein ACI85K_003205 [Hyphomicrobiaceae bacterium]|jgi:hypothetical protein